MASLPRTGSTRMIKAGGSPLYGRLSSQLSWLCHACHGLQELVDIYVKPASEPAPGLNVGKETTIPSAERKIVFTGLDALLQFHKQSFLPSLINAAEILSTTGPGEDVSTRTAHAIANVFVSHAAFMKINFDNAIQRLQFWSAPPSAPNTPGTATPASNTPSTVGAGLSMVAVGIAGVSPEQAPHPATLNAGQRKRIKQFLKRCRLHPRHSQLNLEGYLLLPIQRIPRYKMLVSPLLCVLFLNRELLMPFGNSWTILLRARLPILNRVTTRSSVRWRRLRCWRTA
ncbi:RhoGEF domain-containing protein [Rhizoctonia solani AG-1 IA]|uniref:RhoGEF domain-containing protein n=1 Tax=Thanatephorus cucumeris (strain AG1-IA) TaxID=983506 RepID=L8WI53_THACA|nr:RhoGEF domain-containing protein [Rhizoctonia solani AG-1 IA]